MRSAYPIDILDPRQIQRGIARTVYVVGSGPNGREHWSQIPADAHVIVVNRAMLILDIPKTWWMCEDDTLPDQEWFQQCLDAYIFARETTAIFRVGGKLHQNHPVNCYFTHKAIWDTEVKALGREPDVIPPWTYGGATIACRATQVAAMRGAKEIILIGVEMRGPVHFDGESTAIPTEDREGAWTQVDRFNKIIRWLERSTGCKVKSLSPTALDVPVIPREET